MNYVNKKKEMEKIIMENMRVKNKIMNAKSSVRREDMAIH